MNTKPLPAVVALIAGFVTCIMSFVQRVDTVVFAKRFAIVCVVFFVIGTVVKIIVDKSIKLPESDENLTDEEQTEDKDESEDNKEDGEDDKE